MTRAWRGAVEVDPRARRAWPFLPLRAPICSTWVSEVGVAVRVAQDGSADAVAAPGHPRGGAAEHPCNTRRAA